ncbi:response regulator transcription factor [bacterium]|nr:response regulator transcription factor [bacterium]
MTSSKSNLLIIEDHELTRFALKTAFDGADFIGNLYEADSAESGIEIFETQKIDLIIMDLGLPNMNGIDATRKIHLMDKDVKIVILTSHNDEKEVLNSIKAGANAYCSKEINPQKLVTVVQSVLDGAAWFDPAISHIVLKAATTNQLYEDVPKKADYNLTTREAQILKLITEGYSNTDIASELVVSVNTTKAHVASILQKLGVDDRLQAALKAIKNKIV